MAPKAALGDLSERSSSRTTRMVGLRCRQSFRNDAREKAEAPLYSTKGFLFLVVRPGATSSVLAPSSDARRA